MNERVEYELGCLLISLRSLVLAHPPGLHRIETAAGTLAAVAATLSTLSALSGESKWENVHELMMVLAPATGALATSPGGLQLLVKWASTLCRTEYDQEVAASAAAVSLWVAVHVLRGGAERLPSPLRTAGAAWEHLSARRRLPAAAPAGGTRPAAPPRPPPRGRWRLPPFVCLPGSGRPRGHPPPGRGARAPGGAAPCARRSGALRGPLGGAAAAAPPPTGHNPRAPPPAAGGW